MRRVARFDLTRVTWRVVVQCMRKQPLRHGNVL